MNTDGGSQQPTLAAIILAGGRSSRLNTHQDADQVDKAALTLGGETLVSRVARAAATVGAKPVVVVGPDPALPDVVVTRERTLFAGPLAALAAGLEQVASPEWLLVLSCDLVEPAAVCTALTRTISAETDDETALTDGTVPTDGAVLTDPDGRHQWLAGIYRTAALHTALRDIDGSLDHLPLKRALGSLSLREVPASGEVTADIDTPGDLAQARNRFG